MLDLLKKFRRELTTYSQQLCETLSHRTIVAKAFCFGAASS